MDGQQETKSTESKSVEPKFTFEEARVAELIIRSFVERTGVGAGSCIIKLRDAMEKSDCEPFAPREELIKLGEQLADQYGVTPLE